MRTKPTARVFRLAAELLSAHQAEEVHPLSCHNSPYCCDCISRASGIIRSKTNIGGCFWHSSAPEQDFFKSIFFKDSGAKGCCYSGWWPALKDGRGDGWYTEFFDFESRILALLLCAEMLTKRSATVWKSRRSYYRRGRFARK